MVARITISHNNVITIEASTDTLNLLGEEFKAPDFSECFVFGKFRKERMKMVKFLIRSPEAPTTALLPIGFLKDLMAFFKKHNATYKVIDNRKFEKLEYSDEEIEKCLGYISLYDYQVDAVKAMLETPNGIIKATTASGKTEVFITYCKLTKRKTLILFARIDLAKQTLRRMKKAGLDAGIVQGNNVDENHQVVMATVQSGHKLESQYDCIIVDECFVSKTEILTEYGKDTIGNICRNKKKIKIWSFNETENVFELKPISNWIIKKTNNIIQIRFNSISNIKCTPNHKIYIYNNKNIMKKEAGELTLNDKIIVKNNNYINNGFAPTLSNQQYKAVLGMILGDASLSKSKNLARLRLIHGEKQLDYLIHKQNLLSNMFNSNTKNYSGISGYTQKKCIHYISTRCSQDFKDLYDAIYINGVKSIINIIGEIDDVSLAYWFMDDGSISYNNNIKNPSPMASLATHSFTKKENELIISIFKSKFDLNACLAFDKRCKKYYLRFNVENSKKISNIISKHIPPCMNYKLLEKDKNNYIQTDWEMLNFSVLKPISINIITKNKNIDVYDITVDDNHNYIVGAGYLVSNCHRAAGEQYQILLKNKHTLYRYGFSATPFVKKNKLQVKRTTAWIGDIIYTVHAEKLMDEGRISKPTIHIIPIKKPADIGDLKWPFAETVGIIENKYRNDTIAEIANNLTGQKLILIQKIDHGTRLQALINNSYFLYGESNVKEREEYVARFEAGEPITLIASTIFDEGIDIKTVNHVLVTGGGQSFVKVLQRLGRGLRITETKKTVDIYDFYDYTNPILKKHSDERIKIYKSEGFNDIQVFKIEEFRNK